MKKLKLGIIATFLLALFSCSGEAKKNSSNDSKVVKRVSSTDKKIDAVLVELYGGVTVANSHRVYIVLHGNEIASSDDPIFIADYTTDIDIELATNNILSIKYDKARIFRFTNFWNSDKIDDWKYIVEIKLVNISADGKALK